MSEILPIVLGDFFPAQDVMNKVIGEFVSSQQPHPELMASVLCKVRMSFFKASLKPLWGFYTIALFFWDKM